MLFFQELSASEYLYPEQACSKSNLLKIAWVSVFVSIFYSKLYIRLSVCRYQTIQYGYRMDIQQIYCTVYHAFSTPENVKVPVLVITRRSERALGLISTWLPDRSLPFTYLRYFGTWYAMSDTSVVSLSPFTFIAGTDIIPLSVSVTLRWKIRVVLPLYLYFPLNTTCLHPTVCVHVIHYGDSIRLFALSAIYPRCSVVSTFRMNPENYTSYINCPQTCPYTSTSEATTLSALCIPAVWAVLRYLYSTA